MLHNQASRYSVIMRTELAETLPNVMADRVQLQQVMMNLMLNGIEAMRDTTGELTIKSQLAEEGQFLISVIDTGVGLPAGNTDQIFNPFFTTKSQGTGLGLAITRSILESLGGRVWATANPGRGATFQFTLPSTLVTAGPFRPGSRTCAKLAEGRRIERPSLITMPRFSGPAAGHSAVPSAWRRVRESNPLASCENLVQQKTISRLAALPFGPLSVWIVKEQRNSGRPGGI